MSASNQPPRSVNFPSLLVSEDEGKGISMPEAREDGSSIHSWIDSDFVPSWLRPFSLDATTRFTRTPDHLLRKTEELETGPGFCIGGTGWHFLDMPRDRDDDLSSFPSLKADLDALEMAFSEVQGAARLAQEDSGTGAHLSAGGSFSAEAGLIASFVSAELGTDADEEPSAATELSEASWLEHEWTGTDASGAMSEAMVALDAPEADLAATEALLPEFGGYEALESMPEPETIADMDHAADDGFEDAPTDMTELNTAEAEAEAEAGDVETVVSARMMAPMVDVISPLMAASWAAERAELGGPPAHLLALRQAIILGDEGFAHRPAPDQDLHALPVLDEDDGTDAVMLSDWDQTLPAAPEPEAAVLDANAAEADVAVMLSDFEPESDSTNGMAPIMEMPAVAPAETGVMAVEQAVASVEMIADALLTEAEMDDADEDAWEEAFLSSVCMTGQNEAGVPVPDLSASEDTATPDRLSVADACEMEEPVAVVVADLPDADLEEAAQSDASGSDSEAILVNTVPAADLEDDAAELQDDAFEDILLMDDASAEIPESEAVDASVTLTHEDEAAGVELAVASAPVTAPSALAFTAPVIGAAFGWQPYQQSIASDLMRFGAMAAPTAIVPAAMPESAPSAQADEVAAPLAMPSQLEAPVDLTGQNAPVQDAEPAVEEIAMAEGACAYQLPDLELLCEPPQLEPDYELSEEALDQNSTALQQILRDFGVRGEIIDANPGPVVTLYEFEPAPGVKSSRVIGLADDIARSMSAISARVAVVPGRNVIGIELPNKRRDTVWLRELLSSQEFGEARTKLGIGLGKTIGGEPVIADLARMPHLLVAGTTGSGKSVAINTMILSLLYQHTPEQCRLIMIDPKMLELSIYEGIPHLLTPVVTDPKKAIIALKWAVKEMEDRYRKMARLAVRNIDGFNARMAEARAKGEIITRQVQVGFDKESGEALFEEQEMDLSPLPYIVIIVDEMADLMMVAGKEIEGAIQRLAQMARAAGIHLVMATQRPSVDVITGTIKANFPTRISFQVTSKIDSRTILGEMGAETLLGQGDMLFMAGGGRIQRVHGPFVSDAEVEHVVNFLKTQGGPEYLDEVVTDEEADGPADGEDTAVFDKGALGEGSGDLYDQAVAIVMRDRKASTSYIQRRLQVGYNKAASLMERMEHEGIVGPANHAGKREILAFSRGD